MKKILTVTLAFVLAFSAFSLLAVSAETGEPLCVFNVKGVNGMIGGEDCVLFTTQDAYNSGNPNWAITILLEVKDDGTLVVKEKAIAGQGAVPAGVKVGDGVVALVVYGCVRGWDSLLSLLVVFCGAMLLAVVSIFGDLFASLLKRHFGVKDYGFLFPGHGGVLDRFDSTIPVALVLRALVIWTPLGGLL